MTSKPYFQDGAVERSGTLRRRKDLAEGAGETAPLTTNEDFERRPHLTTFTDEECYQLFIAMDDRARAYEGRLEEVNAIRDRLLPFYRAWHAAHPGEVHPSATRAVAAAHET